VPRRAQLILAAVALALLLLPAAPAAGVQDEASRTRNLLVNGDSLAVGTTPYLPRALRRWRVTQSTAISRHAFEGASIMRAYGRGLPRVIHVSLGTNDDPRSLSGFRAAIREVMAVAGPRRCVVWANIVRPPVAGASYAGYNRVLREESKPRENLRVVDWARMVRQNPGWLAGDGVHVSATGYQYRASRVAESVRRCHN
jgi:predicted DCC family thiol-disulfide oxidoreductase YuxK